MPHVFNQIFPNILKSDNGWVVFSDVVRGYKFYPYLKCPATPVNCTWPRGEGEAPLFYRVPLAENLGMFFGLVKAFRSALVSAVSRLRWFRLSPFSFAFGCGFGCLASAVVSFIPF